MSRKGRVRKRRKSKSFFFLKNLSSAFTQLREWFSRRKKIETTAENSAIGTATPALSDSMVSLWESWHNKPTQKQATPKRLWHSYTCLFRKNWKLLLIILLCSLGITYICAIISDSSKQSQHLREKLQMAIRENDWHSVHKYLNLADTRLIYKFNSHLMHTMREAESWKERQKNKYEYFNQKLAKLESGECRLADLSIHTVADISRGLRDLPSHINDLSGRWDLLLAQNEALLQQNRDSIIHRIINIQPILPLLSHDAYRDANTLHLQINHWKDLLETCSLHHIPDHLEQRVQQHLDELIELEKEVKMLISFYKQLPQISSYEALRTWGKSKKATLYPPACHLFNFVHSLPPQEEWEKAMHPINRYTEISLHDEARRILTQNAPSFSASFPATQEQSSITHELFSALTLHQPFYRIFHADGSCYLTDHYTQHQRDGKECISFSIAEPNHALNRTIICDAQSVKICLISCKKLIQEGGIEKERFFTTVNLPHLLTTILVHQEQSCPALAKAFLFERILDIMLRHPLYTQDLLHELSPTLMADTKSFKQLQQKHAKVMNCGAWLTFNKQVQEAEHDFAMWFRSRQHRCYHREIALRAIHMFQADSQYIGYIDETGTPRWFDTQPAPQYALWYLSPKGIRYSTPGKLPEDALPHSPLFINKITP